MSAGKGDKPRPLQVSPEAWAERWARTFGAPPATETCELTVEPKARRGARGATPSSKPKNAAGTHVDPDAHPCNDTAKCKGVNDLGARWRIMGIT